MRRCKKRADHDGASRTAAEARGPKRMMRLSTSPPGLVGSTEPKHGSQVPTAFPPDAELNDQVVEARCRGAKISQRARSERRCRPLPNDPNQWRAGLSAARVRAAATSGADRGHRLIGSEARLGEDENGGEKEDDALRSRKRRAAQMALRALGTGLGTLGTCSVIRAQPNMCRKGATAG